MGEKQKGCCYCAPNNRCEMNNAGDRFVMQHETGEKWHLCAETRHTFLMLKINYCPMCGRKLKKSDKHIGRE